MKFSQLNHIAKVCQNGARDEIIQALSNAANAADGVAWEKTLRLLAQFARGGFSAAPFSVFAETGNQKLPFVAFSTLPGVTCPGAGECLRFCYSFKSWRFPGAFARQCQNALLLRFNNAVIETEFAKLTNKKKFRHGFDFRLNVDGDFSSVSDVKFWMELLRNNPSVRGYGYSKSFTQLLGYTGGWPANYKLNISSGHNHDNTTVQLVKQLQITRGEFIALQIGRKVKSTDHGTPTVNAALRLAAVESGVGKIFPCPGKCGKCTGKGHACGMQALRGVPIAIAVH